MTLRVSRRDGAVILTIPQKALLRDAVAFARAKVDWLVAALARVRAPQRVILGALLPVAGRALVVTIAAEPGLRSARIDGDRLLVPHAKPAGAVTKAFLKHLAMERLRAACDMFAARLGQPYRAIVLRDTRSRWGSCTIDGRLMFSWRLALAPPEVLDYVAAHEVAHLAQMDHSALFWSYVAQLCPGYEAQRRWLRDHGSELQAWQFHD